MIGRTVVYTDGRREFPAIVLRIRHPREGMTVSDAVLDLAVMIDNGLHVDTVVRRSVVPSPVPAPRLGEDPEYLHPDTWRSV